MTRTRARTRRRARERSLLVVCLLFAFVVSPVAISMTGSPVAAQQAGTTDGNGTDIVVRQGDQCYPVQAFGNGSQSVEEFYGYRSPSTEPRGWYRAYGEVQGLLREDTSQILLYNGSNGMSLVFENDGVATTGGSGGTVAMNITGLPAEGNWSVQDDSYPGQDDVFDLDNGSAHIEWYWNQGNRSDGAAFVGLESENWEEITIDPAFNEESPGYPYRKWDGPPESNEVTSWIVRNPNVSAETNSSMGTNAVTGTSVAGTNSDSETNISTDANTTASADTTTETVPTTRTNASTEANATASTNATGGTNAPVGTAGNGSVATTYELDMSEPITIARGPCDEEAPAAALTVGSENPIPGAEVVLDANGSTDNDAIAAYRWDLDGDGTIETTTNDSTLTAAYNASGVYDPRVTVVDRANNTANASVSLQVEAETTTTTTATATPTATATATASTTTTTESTAPETGSSSADGATDSSPTAAADGGSGGDAGEGSAASGGVEAAVDRASAVADRASEELANMGNANLTGLAVLGVALLVIGLVVLRR
jgi:hypothetical protein